ncbi:hypothetical protein ACI2K4_08055 [Micromonospora sp. NPDC050397]|uniref:hypothetical protein n=1 Tax=Micromonospora sp. NPDC050397 TaxID=3364279 RepID=UPI00384DC8A4
MRRMAAELLAHRTDVRIGFDLRPATMGRGRACRRTADQVEALDDRLGPTAAAPCPPGELLATAPDLGAVVTLDGDDLVVRRGDVDVRVPVPGADSATLLTDGSLLVTAPVFEKRTWKGRTYTAKAEHRVLLIDPAGKIAHEATLEVSDAGMIALAHPYDGSVLLDAGEGQDGSSIFRVRSDGDELHVERILEDAVATDFSPSGDRLLVTPHPSIGGPVRVLSWPDLTPLHELSEETLDEEEGFDLYGCFLSETRVVLSVSGALPLVCTADLVPEGRVALPDEYADAEPETLVGLAEDVIGLDLYLRDESTAATVWRLPPA